jgi:SSS family solute:Na+ symporter
MYMLLSFLFFTGIVALISWIKTRNVRLKTVNDYFLSNRSLGFVLVGSSLFLTNLSGNLLIGENESVYNNNMSVMAWGMTSIFAMLIVSEFFLPIYLRMGAVTTPDFLERRFDPFTKKFVSIVFLVSYMVNLIPTILYGGALAMNGIFHISQRTGTDYVTTICVLVVIIGFAGSLYSILGGLRAMSISDTLLGFGMLAGCILISYYGFKTLGHDDVLKGVKVVLHEKKEHLNAIGSADDAVPFSTIFTGMLLMNLYYWGMEQFIVQQALASKNLKECQKGIALACVGKLLSPLLLNLPGLIAVHLYPHLANTTEVFPRLIADVLPAIFQGFMASIVLGAIFSTFNAGLNSSGTLFIMNIYKPWLQKRKKEHGDSKLIFGSKMFQIALTVAGICIAPLIMLFKGGFYTYIQMLSGFFSVPIFSILIVGFLTRKVPPIAAKIGLTFFILTYAFTILIIRPQLHYLHILGILFVVTIVIMLIIGRIYPLKKAYDPHMLPVVDVEPWQNRHWASGVLLAFMILMFILFSHMGIA